MLLAAMILGLIGGTSYFIMGIVGHIVPEMYHHGTPWWITSLMPIGLVAFAGGILVHWEPKLGTALFALASASAITIGLTSYKSAWEEGGVFFPPGVELMELEYVVTNPLFMLIVAAGLATLAEFKKKRQGM